ncbi:MAG: precorrin-6y C5,15-methyltransferase (decarboxylating) subunit CbiE [Thermoleophilia bacterium]
MDAAEKHILYIVGAGPGSAGLLTPGAEKVIAAARVVAAGRRLLALAPPDAETHAIGADLESTRRFIEARLAQADVCVLVSGDPGCYSVLPFLSRYFRDRIRVLPGISSVQLLAARLQVPWHGWRLVSRHGRGAPRLDAAAGPGAPAEPLLFFCDEENSPQAVARSLLAADPDRRVAVGSHLGSVDERIWQGKLSAAAAGKFPGNSLLLVLPGGEGEPPERDDPEGEIAEGEIPGGKVPEGEIAEDEIPAGETPGGGAGEGEAPGGDVPDRPAAAAPGIPDDLWLRREGVPLSKSEFRAVLMARVQPALRRVIWDVGAGTGSYSVECSLLSPAAEVYAIDRNPEACGLIAANATRFGADVKTVCAAAPECLARLPRPDLVIIGGNDGRLAEIFAKVVEAVLPGGRVAVTAVLDRTRQEAHGLFAGSGLEARQAVRVEIARGHEHEWAANNPVILFTGDRPGNSD